MGIRHNSSLGGIVGDESIQSALQDLIESDALSALCFGSAEEQFLDSEARNKAGCLIADIRMPGMSGPEPQANLKAERCRIPVIFVTAHGDAEMSIHAVREGAVEFLSKLFEDAVFAGDRTMPLSIGEENA